MDSLEIRVWLWPRRNGEALVKRWKTGTSLTILRRYDELSQWEFMDITGPGGGVVSCDMKTAAVVSEWKEEGADVECRLLKKDESGRVLVSFCKTL